MASNLFVKKAIADLQADAEGAHHGLKRSLGAVDLIALGIGAIIGTGIFVLTGRAAEANAGPAVALSFVLAGIASAFAGLCYAEMASMIPIAGSAYTYAYATMGELIAWIIGWDLVLEYLVGAATVSVGWSGYVGAFVKQILGFELPKEWSSIW
jgi:APA family basic amino acid/polyamine antiporter